MTPDEMRDVGRRVYLEAFEKGNVAVFDEVIAEDCIDISPNAPPGVPREGRAGPKAFVSMLHAGFSDITMRIHDLLVDGNTGVGRWTMEGTHIGDFFGVPATGKRVSFDGVDIVEYREGQIRQHYGLVDQVGLLTQLGVIQAPEDATA